MCYLSSRFRDTPDGLLLATDVAARGLDIPLVQHVIHYQVPRTSEVSHYESAGQLIKSWCGVGTLSYPYQSAFIDDQNTPMLMINGPMFNTPSGSPAGLYSGEWTLVQIIKAISV